MIAAAAVVCHAITSGTSGWNNTASTVAGGVTSRVMGGSFANGAQTAAYGCLFNQVVTSGSLFPNFDALQYLKDVASESAKFILNIALFDVGGAATATELVTVGRWMSKAEFDLMKDTGRLIESKLTVTSVSLPASSTAYTNAVSGSLFVEFQIAKDAISASGNGWAKIYGPNSIFANKLGITEMPKIFSPIIKGVKQ